MINTNNFGAEMKKLGYDFYSGVPCSFLKNLINYAINDCDYIMAANEGDAVAIAAGAYLGGKKSVVLMQNSGLTNATSPLTSLNYNFEIPVLGFVSLRGEPGLSDEPQHELMGQITTQMLDTMQLPWQFLSDDEEQAIQQLIAADKYISNKNSFFFVVKKGVFDKVTLKEQTLIERRNAIHEIDNSIPQPPKRIDALSAINAAKDSDTIILATTGKTGRELYEIEDAPNNFYMVGSMGCISSIGLGLALAQPQKKVIAIDGDGALLMRMGSMATNAYYHPHNFMHILLDNNTHDSTGGQTTISHNINFSEIAKAVGYRNSYKINGLEAFTTWLKTWVQDPRNTFVHLQTQKGSKDPLGRPKVKPAEVTTRIMQFMNTLPK